MIEQYVPLINRPKLAEKITSIEGGDLALNEEGKETKLVKFIL